MLETEVLMSSGKQFLIRQALKAKSIAAVGVAVSMLMAGTSAWSQENSLAASNRVSLSEDWSHRHVVFSNPQSPKVAADVQKDPRFLQQMVKRNRDLLQRMGEQSSSRSSSPATSQVSHSPESK